MTRFARSHRVDLMVQGRRIAAITASACALAAPAVTVHAQATQPAPKAAVAKDNAAAEAAFKRADKNGDGKLSKDEAAALPGMAARFDELDKDKDGMLSLAEFVAGYTAG